MVKIKICGITNAADALAAVGAGADALGFNFWKGSRRYIRPHSASSIIRDLPGGVLCVGVFVNEDEPETVEELAAEGGVNAVQLHGSESPEYCSRLSGRLTVIKALRVGPDFDAATAADYPADSILLDGYSEKLQGGTGLTFDWSIARRVGEVIPKLYLAGGLTRENVSAAVREVGPFAVDVCSGVEAAPGRKDERLMRDFVGAAHAAEKA